MSANMSSTKPTQTIKRNTKKHTKTDWKHTKEKIYSDITKGIIIQLAEISITQSEFPTVIYFYSFFLENTV